jgi:hypothetical protein
LTKNCNHQLLTVSITLQVYVTFIIWITLVLSGVGTEYLVWRMYLHGEWNAEKELKWRAAQFLFPLLSMTALGFAITGDFWALPFLGEI